MGAIRELFSAALELLNRMSPYLLFGLLASGAVRGFLRPGVVARHLGGRGMLQSLKATLFGIPLPLCSCGVLPAAQTLRREGAGKGAVISFLVSTPSTGVDSILATWGMLGGLFAFFRILVAFLAGLLGGLLGNLLPDSPPAPGAAACAPGASGGRGARAFARETFRYSFRVLLGDMGGWLLLGVLVGGLIAVLVPEGSLGRYLGTGLPAMLTMFVLGIPMYICSSGSIPIAASLMLKGLSPGAALVFLMAGPVTNTAGLLVIVRELGKGAALVVLAAALAASLAGGLLLETVWDAWGGMLPADHAGHGGAPARWLGWFCSAVILGGILFNFFLSRRSKS